MSGTPLVQGKMVLTKGANDDSWTNPHTNIRGWIKSGFRARLHMEAKVRLMLIITLVSNAVTVLVVVLK